MLVTISGIDGAGKSSLAKKLEHILVVNGIKVKLIEFPCSKVWTMIENLEKKGNKFSTYGLNSTSVGMALNLERLAFIQDVVLPNLNVYQVVILQRYMLDFAAIGRAQNAGIADLELVEDINKLIDVHEISLFVDTEQNEAYRRINKRGISVDIREQYDFHKRLYDSYQFLYNSNIFKCYRLDGNLSLNEITQQALEIIKMGGVPL